MDLLRRIEAEENMVEFLEMGEEEYAEGVSYTTEYSILCYKNL